MSLIGLDVGTTGCKVILFDEAGQILAQASREYSILTPESNCAEQDAERNPPWRTIKLAIVHC